MLFSNDKIAALINANFEPAWVSLRSVPIVRIDFGNGKVITRTLRGNTATSVCTSDGNVLDVLPGVYEPKTYTSQLRQFVWLHRWFGQDQENDLSKFRQYHTAQAQALAKGAGPLELAYSPHRKNGGQRALDATKEFPGEEPLEIVLGPVSSPTLPTASNLPEEDTSAGLNAELWNSLVEDTRVNELTRRRMIHEYLAKKGLIAPGEMTKWMYREVLHADLDDPHFGLGEVLFATYPFREEDGD